MEKAKPKKIRPVSLDAEIEEALLIYQPTIKTVCNLIKIHWSYNHWVPTFDEEILSIAYLVFVKAYRDRDKHPLLFPPPPELLYTRIRWTLVKQWVPRESIHRYHSLEPYDTLEHWKPDSPDYIATRDDLAGNDPTNIFPYDVKPDLLDMWYLGASTVQIGMIYDITSRTVLRIIHSYYNAIEKAIEEAQEDDPIPLAPPVPRPRRGACNVKPLSI